MSFSLLNPFCYFDTCSAVLEGKHGPVIQTGGIILFVFIFNYLIRKLLLNLQVRFNSQHNVWAWSFVTALPKPLASLVWYVAAICSVDTISSGFFDVHLLNINIILSVGFVLTFGWFLLRWNARVCHAMIEMSQNNGFHITPGKLDLISKLATMCVIFVTLFLLMDVTGRNVQTLIAFGGIGGLALAFASQQVIANFFGGLMVYITQPFTIGEWVNLPEKKIEGYIEEIGWYLTRIRNFEKRPIYVPNSIFTQTIVITPSRMSHERFHTTIGLRYSNLHVIKPIVDSIKLMLVKHPQIDQRLKVDVYFTGFGPSSLDIEISAYMSKSSGVSFSSLKQELFFKIADIVDQHGGQLATPTNIVEIHGGMTMNNEEKKFKDMVSSNLNEPTPLFSNEKG